MNPAPKKLRLILLGLLALTALVFLLVSAVGLKVLSQKSQLLIDAKVQQKTAEAQLISLEVAKKQVERYGYFNEVARTVIPNDKDQAATVQNIFQLASRSGIEVANISFPASSLGGTAGSAASAGSAPSVVSQAKPVEGIKGLYSLEMTITPLGGDHVPAGGPATGGEVGGVAGAVVVGCDHGTGALEYQLGFGILSRAGDCDRRLAGVFGRPRPGERRGEPEPGRPSR